MAIDIVQLIFDQFLEIVQRLSRKSCFEFNECDFEYRVREYVGHRLIDVIHINEDKCCRRKDAVITIDSTSICVEDLTSCKWVNYLEKLALEFINEICPKKLVVIKEEPKGCRPQPPKWQPFPCRNVTTIIRKKKPVCPEPECEVIIQNECECVPVCKRCPCIPSEKVIIKYENENQRKCGDYGILVETPAQPKHDFNSNKGHKDYNNHLWKPCCGQTTNLANNATNFYESGYVH